MNQFCTMKIVEGFSNLIHDIFLMFFLENFLSDEGVQINVHELKNNVDVKIILCSEKPF